MLMSSARRIRRKGFTLVELMIAITVMSLAVLTTFTSQLEAHSLVRQSGETNTAMADLQSAMEQVLILQVDQIPIPASRFRADTEVASFSSLHLRNEAIVSTYPGYTGGSVPDPLQIVLTCTWNDFKGRQRSLRLASMKTR